MAMKKPKTTAAQKKAPAKKATETKLVGKTALVDALADKLSNAGVTTTKKDLGVIVDTLQNVISDEVGKGNTVRLLGFGSFLKKTTAARKGRNLRTGEEIDIPESNRLYFKTHVRY